MSIVKDVFGSGFELYDFLSKKAKVKNVTRRLLIRELRNNLKRLEYRNNNGVNRVVLIERLENSSIIKAIESGFNFNSIAPKQKIDSSTINIIKQAIRYEGWDADKIINSIDEKIISLKEANVLYDDINSAPINITSRLNNLYILMILLSVLIKTYKNKK